MIERRLHGLMRVVRVRVPTPEGETIAMACRAAFSDDGALLRIFPPPPAPSDDPRWAGARRLVQRLDAELARPGAPGLFQIHREAEAFAALLEHVLDVEAEQGSAVRDSLVAP